MNRSSLTRTAALLTVVAAIGQTSHAQLAITEIHTKAQTDPEDFFELYNTGNSAVDIAGWKFDDESADIADAVGIIGVTNIAPGEVVVIFQLDEDDPNDPAYDPAGETTLFRDYWGGLAGVQVGYHAGAGLGKGDAITIFDDSDNIVLSQEYGMTTPNQTHAGDWAAGNTDGSDIFENDSAIWVPGTSPAEFVRADGTNLGSFANTDGDYGSPGVVPEPASATLLALGGLALIRRRR